MEDQERTITFDEYYKLYSNYAKHDERINELMSELKRKDSEIAELKDTLAKKELAFELITKQQFEEIKQLKSDFGKVRYDFQQMNSRLMNDIITYKEQIQQLRDALKDETKLREQIASIFKVTPEKKSCPNCLSENVIMFNADLDLCKNCGQTY